MEIAKDKRYLNSLEIQKRLMFAENYNDWLFTRVEKYIGNCVLEVGCALGNFTQKIFGRSFVCAIDIEEEYVKVIKNFLKEQANLETLQCDISSPEALRLKHRFDTVICFNVIEHIEEDDIALANMYQLLNPNGYLCLIAPAFPSIFGEMDITDHHYRRYTRKLLLEKIKKVKFNVLSLKYINILGFFSWWFNGRILRHKFIPLRQLLLYDKIIPLISSIENLINPPFGQSLVLVAQKQ